MDRLGKKEVLVSILIVHVSHIHWLMMALPCQARMKKQENSGLNIHKRCRAIAAEMGKQLGTPAVHNIWIPDGSKDTPVDRNTLRKLLKKSLDEIFAVKYPKKYLKDSVESKLFGIGSESMVVGSHDFYMGYAIKNNIMITLDNGHFHPTEQVGDKISSILHFVDEILLHLPRGVRWDSDHVLTFNDELLLIAQEIIRAKALGKSECRS